MMILKKKIVTGHLWRGKDNAFVRVPCGSSSGYQTVDVRKLPFREESQPIKAGEVAGMAALGLLETGRICPLEGCWKRPDVDQARLAQTATCTSASSLTLRRPGRAVPTHQGKEACRHPVCPQSSQPHSTEASPRPHCTYRKTEDRGTS